MSTGLRYVVTKTDIAMFSGQVYYHSFSRLVTDDLQQAYDWACNMAMIYIDNTIVIYDRTACEHISLDDARKKLSHG